MVSGTPDDNGVVYFRTMSGPLLIYLVFHNMFP
jgi:hypothetical protein